MLTGFRLSYDSKNNAVTGFRLVDERFQTFYEWMQLCNPTDTDADAAG